MEIWQMICLAALALAAVLMVILVRNMRMMKEIWLKEDKYEGYELAEKMKNLAENQRIFIGDMAHEIKTPLTAILAFAEILSVKPDITDKERMEYSKYIHEEAVHLKDMSEKLLQLIQFEGANLQKRELSLKEVINEVLEAERLICEKEGILLESELCECRLEGEKDLLKSLFYNLIDNARKASRENGRIQVCMEYEGGEKVKIQIIDYGTGIAKEELKNITKPFYTVEKSIPKKPRGTGLGLPLCQRIIEYHGGELGIESELGKGSIFTVRLPVQ